MKKSKEQNNEKKILCIGNAAFDITLPIEKYPKENEKIKTNSKIENGGGSAANACVLLALWDYHPLFVGAVGDDYFGDRVIGAMENYGIDIAYLDQVEECHTTTSIVLPTKKNNKRTIITFEDPNLYLEPKDIKVNLDYILCDGHHLEMTQRLIELNPHAIKIIDAGRDNPDTMTLCYAMDYIVCSKSFAEKVTKMKIDPNKKNNMKNVYDKLNDKFNTNIIITLEEKGSFTKIDSQYKLIPSIKVDTKDPTGAGDAYHGALLYFLANDYDLEIAMELANVAGALTTTKLGGRTSFPTLQEVLNYDK